MNIHKRQVLSDCRAAVLPSAVFNVLDAVVGALLSVYTSSVLAKLADAIFEQNWSCGMETVATLVLCVFISLIVMPLFGTIKEILLFDNALKHNRMIYGRFLNKRFREAQRFTEGEVQYRLEQDAIDLRCMWLDLVTKCIATPIMLGYLLYHSIRISLLYTIIIFLVSALKLFVPVVTKKLNVKYDKEAREYQTNVRSYEFEILNQPHKVKMFGLTMPLLQRFDQVFSNYFRDTLKKSVRLSAITSNVSRTLDTLCTIFILLSGAVLVATGGMTVGGIAAAFGFLSVFSRLFGNISSLIRDFPVFGTLVDRLTIFYLDGDNASGIWISSLKEITAEELSFSYDEKVVLQHVSFSIHQGDKVAVCGQNGTGKSTLIQVLSGLQRDYTGSIKVDGNELSKISAQSWYDCFAYTEQDPYLFPFSIRDNIHIGNLKASDNEVDDVIRALEIEYLVTRDAGNTVQLSGGEKQKISIARALLKNTPLIIMDEPSNNLDRDALMWLRNFIINSSKTIVFVTHDSDLLCCADYTICL